MSEIFQAGCLVILRFLTFRKKKHAMKYFSFFLFSLVPFYSATAQESIRRRRTASCAYGVEHLKTQAIFVVEERPVGTPNPRRS